MKGEVKEIKEEKNVLEGVRLKLDHEGNVWIHS
jgi:hypothetical protein